MISIQTKFSSERTVGEQWLLTLGVEHRERGFSSVVCYDGIEKVKEIRYFGDLLAVERCRLDKPPLD